MSTLDEAIDTLRTVESGLRACPPGEGLDPARIAERIHQVVELLAGEEAHWIGTTEAKRLLGVASENTVKAWARIGLLRSRTRPNGRIQVLLDDVLERRAATEDLTAIGGEELSSEELRILRETRPGINPWQREKSERSS